jgi:hypothetical protein
LTWGELLRRACFIAWVWYRKPATQKRIVALERELYPESRKRDVLYQRAVAREFTEALGPHFQGNKIEWLQDAGWNTSQIEVARAAQRARDQKAILAAYGLKHPGKRTTR